MQKKIEDKYKKGIRKLRDQCFWVLDNIGIS